jgi:hypothetical protein
MSPDKPGHGPGSDLTGRRNRTLSKPREHTFLKSSLSLTGEDSTEGGKLGETADGSGGVMAAARQEGLHRDWRNPPGPGEKPPGER